MPTETSGERSPNPTIEVLMDFEEPLWPELQSRMVHQFLDSSIQVAALEGGLPGGRTSLAIRFDLEGEHTIIAESSLEAFLAAAEALKARYPR